MKRRTFTQAIGSGAATLAWPLMSFAQAGTAALAELAALEGPERQQRLVSGAQKEGALSIYTSAPTDDIAPLVTAFEARYAIKAKVWRASSEKLLQRSLAEARAKRHTVDLIETNGPELESLSREEMLQAVKSPHHAQLIAQALRPHGQWVGTRLNVFVQAFNTRLVSPDERPAVWDDLAHPRWKGRLGIEAEDHDWLAGMAAEIGEGKALPLFRRIVATNGVSVRRGHTLLTQLVVAGEIPFALTVYNYKAEQFKKKGAPIDWLSLGTPIARPNGAAVARHAPNPHAALLFYDHAISEEGQRILAGRDFVPVRSSLQSPLGSGALRVIDAADVLDHGAKWTRLFGEVFGSKTG